MSPALWVPENTVTLDQTLELCRRLHPDHEKLRTVLRMVENTGVRKRHIVQPLNDTLRHPGVEVRTRIYQDEIQRAMPGIVAEALQSADLPADGIDARRPRGAERPCGSICWRCLLLQVFRDHRGRDICPKFLGGGALLHHFDYRSASSWTIKINPAQRILWPVRAGERRHAELCESGALPIEIGDQESQVMQALAAFSQKSPVRRLVVQWLQNLQQCCAK
ncbi:hypothetical protein SAMN05421507_108148 [Lentzea jiangxiensis]|uniref:Uncharacterized protein n=1 Tax=Lentzea jiangxiensis TaxID=641025 RepID=A0A1H0SNL6_9PSEU|nr:hypothetical protein [Lentzea jiangxiensis]SDP42766.1 hypothetical protein SAMN05421507_108148 [Lentzea jiangxiensis]